MSQPEDDPLTASTLAAGLLKEYTGDRQMFLEMLARLLEEAVPAHVDLERAGGWFSKDRPVRAVTVDLGDNRFTLEAGRGGTLAATRVRVVRGIALKTDELAVEEWLDQLSAELYVFARTHSGALEALRKRLW